MWMTGINIKEANVWIASCCQKLLIWSNLQLVDLLQRHRRSEHRDDLIFCRRSILMKLEEFLLKDCMEKKHETVVFLFRKSWSEHKSFAIWAPFSSCSNNGEFEKNKWQRMGMYRVRVLQSSIASSSRCFPKANGVIIARSCQYYWRMRHLCSLVLDSLVEKTWRKSFPSFVWYEP
jgi:hypothetical protein